MTFLQRYEVAIDWIVGHCGGQDKFAHTYVGLGIWTLAWLVLPPRWRSWLPVAIVALAELGNECIDRLNHGSWQWPDTLGDIAATLFWPAVLTLVQRWDAARKV